MKKLACIIVLLSSTSCFPLKKNTIDQIHEEKSINLVKSIDFLTEKWQLINLQKICYPSLFSHYVASAYSHKFQQHVILKISESDDEYIALDYLQGDGIIKLLDYNRQYHGLLLEYIPVQGTLYDFLLAHDDNKTIDQFMMLYKKIHDRHHDNPTPELATMHDYFACIYQQKIKKIPQTFIQQVQQMYEGNFKSHRFSDVLHADLHCANILRTQDTFVAIDPLVMIGPLEYEVAVFLVSPTNFLLEQPNLQVYLQNRLNRLSNELQLDKSRLKDCAFMRLMILAILCETQDKNDDWIEQCIQVADIVNQLDV